MLWRLKTRIGKRKIVLEGPENWHCDWLVLPLLLATPMIQISQDQKCRSHKRNQMKIRPFWFLWLRFSRAYDSAYDSYFQFSPRRNRSYEWLDSVAGENQSQRIKEGLHLQWWCKAGFVVIWPSEEYTNAVQYCFRPRMTWICFH